MVLDEDRVKACNDKLADEWEAGLASGRSTVDFCCSGALKTGHTLNVEKVNVDGMQVLALVVRDAAGKRTSALPKSNSASLITVRTCLTRLSSVFGKSPADISDRYDASSKMQPGMCCFLGPAGNASDWEKAMKPVSADLVRSYALALRDNGGTLIPNDKQIASRIEKAKKTCKTEDAFVEWAVDNLFSAPGSPHISHAIKHVTESGPLQVRSNLMKRGDRNMATPFDEHMDPDVLADVRQKYGPGRIAPVPLYQNTSMVLPDEYTEVASRLTDSVVYVTLWMKVIDNKPNKVQTLKCGIDKIAIAELGPERGSGSRGVVDIFGDAAFAEKRSADDSVVDVLDIASGSGGPSKKARKSD